MSNSTQVLLSSLLTNTPYLLAYTLPLLLLSLIITFAGTFLTLDRTRTFVPRGDAVEPLPAAYADGYGDDDEKSKWKKWFKLSWMLQGGVGGLAGGYVFGLHTVTLLALAIPSNTASSPLSATSFLVVWVLSVIPTTILAGRFKYAALGMFGSMGGIALSLGLSVVLHPSLLTRHVFLALFTTLLTVLSLLPLRTQHFSLRLASSSLGSLGTCLSISLLASPNAPTIKGIPPWSNLHSRFWLSSSPSWGTDTPASRGLDAAFCLLLVFGAITDWGLHRYFGEDPDERWDRYLAEYARGLPTANGPGAAGNFRPLENTWDKVLTSLGLRKKNTTFPEAFLVPGAGDEEFKVNLLDEGKEGEGESELTNPHSLLSQVYGLPGLSPWESPTSNPTPKLKKAKTVTRTDRPTGFGFVTPPPLPSSSAHTLTDEKGLVMQSSISDPSHSTFHLIKKPTFLRKSPNVVLNGPVALRELSPEANERRKKRAAREMVRFKPIDGYSSGSSDDEGDMRGVRERKVHQGSGAGQGGYIVSDTVSLSGETIAASDLGHGSPKVDSDLQAVNGQLNVEDERAKLVAMRAAFGDHGKKISMSIPMPMPMHVSNPDLESAPPSSSPSPAPHAQAPTPTRRVTAPPEYSDLEEDDVRKKIEELDREKVKREKSMRKREKAGGGEGGGWVPGFMRRRQSLQVDLPSANPQVSIVVQSQTHLQPQTTTSTSAPALFPTSNQSSHPGIGTVRMPVPVVVQPPVALSLSSAPAGAVPVTPSLINALDRIARAQVQVGVRSQTQTQTQVRPKETGDGAVAASNGGGGGTIAMQRPGPVPVPRVELEVPGVANVDRESQSLWNAFWNDVHSKAAEGS